MRIGTVANLWRYPIKSLAAQALTDVALEPDGLAGDRRAALLVGTAGHARSGKPYRGKEHARLHTVATPAEAHALGAEAGVDLELTTGARYFDDAAISLIWDTWLHDVEALVGRRLDPLRYRPNIYVHAADGWTQREAALVGATLAIGDTVLQIVAPIHRCVTTTYDVGDGQADPAILRVVAAQRANIVGVYGSVLRGGHLRCGDAIERR